MIESVSVNEWKAQANAKVLLNVLEDKFGSVPPDLREKIEATLTLDILNRWILIAAKVDSLDKFREAAGV